MAHEKGFRLARIGKVPPIKGIQFRYTKRNLALAFYADRRHWGGTVTGTYSVSASFAAGQMLGDERWPVERTKMEAVAADIDVGLRAWPAAEADEARPIGVIYFLFWTLRELPHNGYNFAFGDPCVLREIPISTRWSKNSTRQWIGWNRGSPDGWQSCTSLSRNDGVQLVRVPSLRGPENDGPDTYRYLEGHIVIDFRAERRLTSSIATDTWEVQLDPPPHRDGLSSAKRTQLGETKCREIVGNIEEALFAWIPGPGETEERKVPVNRVVFLDAP